MTIEERRRKKQKKMAFPDEARETLEPLFRRLDEAVARRELSPKRQQRLGEIREDLRSLEEDDDAYRRLQWTLRNALEKIKLISLHDFEEEQ